MLDLLDIEGRVVTTDATGTLKEIAQTTIERGAECVLSLKDNQSTLTDAVKLYFQDAVENEFDIAEFDFHASLDKDHRPIDIPEYRETSRIGWLESKPEWKGLPSICTLVELEQISKRLNVARYLD